MERVGRHNYFSVHVGNFPAHATETQLIGLFAGAGDVKEVFVQPCSSSYTYAFVRYKTLQEAQKASSMFNRQKIDGSILQVSLSESTKNRMASDKDISGKSITRDRLPCMAGNKYSFSIDEENQLHRKLKISLNTLNNKDKFTEWLGINSAEDKEAFMKDFRNVLVHMSSIPQSVSTEPFKFEEVQTNKTSLQQIIIRYHETKETRQLFKEVDMDITGGKTLSVEDVHKYFPKGCSDDSTENKLPLYSC